MATREYHRAWRAKQGEGARHARNEYSRKHYWDNRDKALTRQRAWRARNKDRVKETNLQNQPKRYGITYAEKCRVFHEDQFDACAICRSQDGGGSRGWHIDHDHGTGEFRGVLCAHCNVMLGRARDNPEILRRAAQYLEERGCSPTGDGPLSGSVGHGAGSSRSEHVRSDIGT